MPIFVRASFRRRCCWKHHCRCPIDACHQQVSRARQQTLLPRNIVQAATTTTTFRLRHFSASQSLRRNRLFTSSSTDIPGDLHNNNNNKEGLFSIPNLRHPSDFITLAQDSMTECNALRQSLSQVSSITSVRHARQVLHQLDDISKNVCSVIDAAELCRSVHVSAAWRDGASRAFNMMSEYIGQLNADRGLYEALSQVTTTTSSSSQQQYFAQLSSEERRFATLLQAEFERDGIHLPSHKREVVQKLQTHVTQLETLFSENIIKAKRHFEADLELVEQVVPRHVLAAHVAVAPSTIMMTPFATASSSSVTLCTDTPIAHTLSKFSSSAKLRRQIYMETNTACPENLQVLDALRQCRHQVAVLQGFSSFADRVLRDKMAQNQANVYSFLQSLQTQLDARGGFKREMAVMRQAKQAVEGESQVEPWDVSFYTGLCKAKAGLDVSSTLPEYLTVSNCLQGMTMLVDRLFGIVMKQQPMSEEERWDVEDSSHHGHQDSVTSTSENTSFSSHQAIQKFVLEDETGRALGTMYLDLHPREGKYQHAAHFTVRCGCVVGGPSSTEYQLPVVALVCNLSPPRPESDALSHAEVETLFHEFGHALHSLLSRTTFQHVSGTRAAMDFVETPSHLMENFAWDPQFLSLMARHHVTGEAIPKETLQRLVQSRYAFRNLELQNQILYSRFDQILFGVPDSSSEPSTTEIFAKLHRDHNVPYAEGTHWHSRFGHLVTYGAGYYGYLYSQVFAGAIWKRRFAGNSLRRESGDRVWRDMLIHGGAKDPNLMLKDLLEGEPTVDSFMDSIE